jgi:cell division protein FtsZ
VIQEAAHEDANIIFGAVIDDTMPNEEMRVTVIATGLDDDHARRGRERESLLGEASNVTPLRREPAPAEFAPVSAEHREPAPHGEHPEQTSMLEPPAPEPTPQSDDWLSPFDDELDVPTFIRRGGVPDDEEDRDEPAFLRRSAD